MLGESLDSELYYLRENLLGKAYLKILEHIGGDTVTRMPKLLRGKICGFLACDGR